MYKISESNLIREIDCPSTISKPRNHFYRNLIDKSLMDFSKLCQTKHMLGRYHFLLEFGNIPRSRDVIEVCQLWGKMTIPCFPDESVGWKVVTAIHIFKFVIKSTQNMIKKTSILNSWDKIFDLLPKY